MRAGSLRDRVRIERKTTTGSASGASRPNWKPVHECYANIRAVGQSQQVRADQVVAPLTHEIRIRYFAELDTKCRIIAPGFGAGGAMFEVTGVIDPDGKRSDMIVQAIQVDA